MGAYTSGNWHVTEGKVDDFKDAWQEMARWSEETYSGAKNFALYQQDDNPHHFISLAEWDSHDTVEEWRANPDFQKRLGEARAMCNEFSGLDYTQVASY